ncbi:MAG TPA: hypothetical protein VMH33_10660 [Solirubrobacterales bacterium]|nr:hypothetical protein [Solirubrobacterales bacterium]
MVRLIARHGLIRIEQVRRALGAGRSVTYRRLARLVEAGLVERVVVPGVGTLLRATRTGIRWTGLPFSVAAVFPAQVTHTLRCVDVAIEEGERVGHEDVITERELIAIESVRGEPFASVAVGMSLGKPRRHRGDLACCRRPGRS